MTTARCLAVVIAGACLLWPVASVTAAGISIRTIEAPAPQASVKRYPDQLPGSRATHGDANIAAAWLAGATTRYDHGVLGDAVEASRLMVETRNGETLDYVLPQSRVFEDLLPRIVDLNGDGDDEIMIVETDSDLGASLTVFGIAGDRIVPKTKTPFLGQSYRWLNPLGVGDFDADGRLDIALVATPHIGGRLRLYRYTTPTLEKFAETGGVSTHAIGSRELGLGRIVPGSDRDRLLLPDQSHRSMLLLEWTPGGIRELAREVLPARIATSLEPGDESSWRFQTDDGRHWEVRVR